MERESQTSPVLLLYSRNPGSGQWMVGVWGVGPRQDPGRGWWPVSIVSIFNSVLHSILLMAKVQWWRHSRGMSGSDQGPSFLVALPHSTWPAWLGNFPSKEEFVLLPYAVTDWTCPMRMRWHSDMSMTEHWRTPQVCTVGCCLAMLLGHSAG